MTVIQGFRQGFGYNVSSGNNDSANEALDISSMLDILRPTDVPLLKLVGRDTLRKSCTQVKHEWLEDEVPGQSTTTTDVDLDDTGTGSTACTVSAGEGLKFRGATNDYDGPSDVVRITSTAGEELARVISSSSTVVTVDRGYASWSTPVDHTGYTKTITIIGTMQVQGLVTPGESRTTTKTNKYNYTQIFEDTLKANATVQATDKWLSQDEMDLERQNLLENMGRKFENTLLYGKKQAPANQDPGAMDGIRAVISTNVYDKAAAALLKSHLEDALEAIWQAGGDGEVYGFVNSVQKRRINTFLDAYRQAAYSDETLGTTVQRFEADFGTINLVLDRQMSQNEVLLVSKGHVGFGPLRGNGRSRALAEYPVPPTSAEANIWQWTGEYTAETRLEKTHARIHTLATTGLY